MGVAKILENARVEAEAALTLDARMDLRVQAVRGKFSKIEHEFRDMLVAAGAYTYASLPHALPALPAKPQQSTDQALGQNALLTEAPLTNPHCDVFRRLGIHGLGGDVLIQGPPETTMHANCKCEDDRTSEPMEFPLWWQRRRRL